MASRTCLMWLHLHTRRCRWVTSAQRLAGPWSASGPWGAALHGGAKRSRCIAAGWAITRAAASAAASEPDGAGGGRAQEGPFPGSKKLVFLGTPDVAAGVLATLLDAAAAPGAGFHVAAVVSQPAKPRGRRKGGGSNNASSQAALPSPVAQCALDRGLAPELVLTPPDAKDPGFLETLRCLQPDVCVTAAYGHYLPAAFLSIPPRGTVNIHPSLLPKYRGAAPVQRALQAGETVSGVTVLYTVKAMDAGPIIAQEAVDIAPDAQHMAVLSHLFGVGTQLLLASMPRILDGSAQAAAVAQEDAFACAAPKIDPEEGVLAFSRTAQQLHDTVRAFQGWPGTRATLFVEGGAPEGVAIKVLTTRVGVPATPPPGDVTRVHATKEALSITCDDGSVLDVLQLQVPGGKPMSAGAYVAGLRGMQLRRAATS